MVEQREHLPTTFIAKVLRDLAEAIEDIEAIKAGRSPPDGRTPDEAIRDLECIISLYDVLIQPDGKLSQMQSPEAKNVPPT
jgi:hypothetical protein